MSRRKGTPKKSSDVCIIPGYIPKLTRRVSFRKRTTPHTFKVNKPTEGSTPYHLGRLLIGTTNNVLPRDFEDLRISFKITNSDDGDEYGAVTLEYDQTTIVIIKSFIDIHFIEDLVTTVFALNFHAEGGTVYVELFVKKLPLNVFYHKVSSCIKTVFKLLFNIEADTSKDIKQQLHDNAEVSALYDKLIKLRKSKYDFLRQTEPNEKYQHQFLNVSLRQYQIEAVRWMLYRERIVSRADIETLHPMYTAIKLPSGLEIYFDPYSGHVTNVKPLIEPCSCGGILADEMGLGKTVEVLACILLNPKDGENSFKQGSQRTPIIDIYEKRKRSKEVAEPRIIQCIQPKKLKVSNEFVKRSSLKSATRLALQTWYEDKLSEFQVGRSKQRDKLLVQCICGSSSEELLVECDSCGKHQHADCLGYNKDLGKYYCPQCWTNQPLVEVGTTLIVTPLSLRKQWINEIRRHICRGIRVLQYDGNNNLAIYPTTLQKYDVVVTTYNVLQAELRLTEQYEVVKLRREKKYSPPGCTLTRVKWWRLCLDEAQTVDAPSKMVSEMARKIPAVYRWAVTGTPINKNISDLQGLIDYLQITPYNDFETWKNILYVPFISGNETPMLSFLSDVLWRTSKKDVYDQINIPKQTFEEHFLEFSAVEKFFYKREHELSRNVFLNTTINHDPSLLIERIHKSTLNTILAPLLNLRLTCTHPSTIKGRYLATRKQLTSMKDLLEALIQKNISDSEESLRLIISSLNGLAGIYLIMGKHQEAIDYYRQVLQLTVRFSEEKNNVKLSVDKLQMIHTLHNLAEVIENHPPEQPTLRDECLRKDCYDTERKYMEKFINDTSQTYKNCLEYKNQVDEINSKFTLKYGQWYSDGLDWTVITNHFNDLIHRIQTACSNANVTCNLSTSERNIMRILLAWNDDIISYRSSLFNALSSLYDILDDRVIAKATVVHRAMDCHLRPQKKQGKVTKCPVCVANVKLKQYEGRLFHIEKRQKTFEDMSLKGSWKPTIEELIMRSLYGLLKAKNAVPEYYKDAENHINLVETWKKEFKEVRHFWTLLDQQMCAQDELDICKLRLQLKENEENPVDKYTKNNAVIRILKNLTYTSENKTENMNLLSVHEIDYQNSYLTRELETNMALLEKLLGTQKYLETLKKQQYEGQNPDPCPICKNVLEEHWSILMCGHSYCLECIQFLLNNTFGSYIQCSMCRNKQRYEDISYIKAGNTVSNSDCRQIKGNYSTKIEAVIKLLLDLKSKEPNVKVLVFSFWVSVLKCIRDSLNTNNISCDIAETNQFEQKIERFKDPNSGVMALLLPINLGSKGLNLIEATHVLFVEPPLNPSDELQAIGRVHRIGQTKPTVVHKFIIKDTIEERIYQATTSNAENWEKNKITLKNLIDLFKNTSTEEKLPRLDEDELSVLENRPYQENLSLSEEVTTSQEFNNSVESEQDNERSSAVQNDCSESEEMNSLPQEESHTSSSLEGDIPKSRNPVHFTKSKEKDTLHISSVKSEHLTMLNGDSNSE